MRLFSYKLRDRSAILSLSRNVCVNLKHGSRKLRDAVIEFFSLGQKKKEGKRERERERKMEF
jgi:hypothetical protein